MGFICSREREIGSVWIGRGCGSPPPVGPSGQGPLPLVGNKCNISIGASDASAAWTVAAGIWIMRHNLCPCGLCPCAAVAAGHFASTAATSQTPAAALGGRLDFNEAEVIR